MLPTDRKLTDEQTEEVIGRFSQFISETGMSQATAAAKMHLTASAVSEWSRFAYKANPDPITRTVNDWMERETRRRHARRDRNYVKTWLAEDMRTIVYQADKSILMAVIVVPSGAGKTMVLKAMTEEMRGLYVYCESGMTSLGLFRSIAESLGWRKDKGSRAELRRFIILKLAGTNRVIFLDEAHQLGAQIGAIRGIYDEARVPIVMAGTEDILKFVNDRSHGRGQMSSRTIRYNCLDYVRDMESPDGSRAGRDLFTIEEIHAFFAMKKIKINREAIDLLWALACLPNYGTLRLVENAIDLVFGAQSDLQTITRDDVLGALASLVGSECDYLEKLARRHLESKRPAPAASKAG